MTAFGSGGKSLSPLGVAASPHLYLPLSVSVSLPVFCVLAALGSSLTGGNPLSDMVYLC